MTGQHRWRFWLITLAAAVAMAVTASLGQWQLSRAAQKLALQAGVDAQKQRPALRNGDVAAAAGADALHRPVVLRGTWQAAHTVFLDNRQMNGRPGFYVLTPLALEGQPTVLLVQRGWVARDFVQRDRLPPVQTPTGVVELAGRVMASPGRLFEFDSAGTGSGSSVIRQNLDLAAFRAETRLPLVTGFAVLQTGGPSEGLQRDWPEAASGVGKHYGYAFQWFGLCGLIAILYVWFQFIAPRRKARLV